jgi:hypothetical protein
MEDNAKHWVLKIILINQSTSQAKYSLWDMVDQRRFKGLSRDGKPITKTYNGIEEKNYGWMIPYN